MRPAVFLDRDGVLNRATVIDGRPFPPTSLADLVVLPGVVEACRRLKEAGFALVLVTNQPDVARGTARRGDVDALNAVLQQRLGLDEVVVCDHDDADGCRCRKSRPGMVVDAAERLDLDLGASVLVGDRWRDIEAGRRAGVVTVFIDRGYSEQRPETPDHVASELIEAVPFILRSVEQRLHDLEVRP